MPFPTRPLGKNGPQVTAIGIGLMGLSAYYGPLGSDADRLAFLDHLYASGQRFWDTADVYGDSEELLGRWFRANPGKRDTIVLATKFGSAEKRSDPEWITVAYERSVKRLGVDVIDLYYMHRADTVTPIEDTMEALVALKKQGKIRHIGLSEVSASTLRRAYAVHPVAAVQLEYSPIELEIEHADIGLLQTCRELGVALVAYSPLGRGLVTGRIKSPADIPESDFRRFLPRFAPENFDNNIKIYDTLRDIASRKDATPAQLALAWLLRQWDMVIPIPGTTRIAAFDENMGALSLTLTDAENAAIRSAVEAADIVGGRYSDGPLDTWRLLADTAEKK